MSIGKVSIEVDADLKALEKELESLSLAKNLSKDEKSWQKLLKGQYSTRISQEKKITNLSVKYQKQGLSKEIADQKALSESRLTGIDAEYARRKRLEDELLAYTQKKEIANQKKIADARKKFWSNVSSTAIGTSVGNLASKGAGALAGASSGEINSFSSASARLEIEQSLSGRFSKDAGEINATIRELRLKSGESFDAIANTMVDFNSQLKNTLSKNQQADVIKNLSRFSDNFATISELSGEYVSYVASASDIVKGSELANIISEKSRRDLNMLKDSQQLLVDIGLFRDLNVKELESERQRALEGGIEKSGAIERTPTAVTSVMRESKLNMEDFLLKGVRDPINAVDLESNRDTALNTLGVVQASAMLAGGTGFEKAALTSATTSAGVEFVGDAASKGWETISSFAKHLAKMVGPAKTGYESK